MTDVTQILAAIERGDPGAAGALLPLVYDELRKLAADRLSREKPGQTLQATALVHEAYMRLVGPGVAPGWDGRGHFFAAAAEAMRRILREATGLVIGRIVPTGRGHVVHTGRGLRVVDHNRVSGDGDVRPTARVASDGGAGRVDEIVRARESARGDEQPEYDPGCIPPARPAAGRGYGVDGADAERAGGGDRPAVDAVAGPQRSDPPATRSRRARHRLRPPEVGEVTRPCGQI